MKKIESFLARKKLLSDKEYKAYQEYKSDLQKRKYKSEIGELKKQSTKLNRQERYNRSRTGVLSRGVTKGFKFARRGQVTNSLYGNTTNRRVGRPRGSLDPRYRQYGGVYGYRKFIATQNFIAKQNALRNASLTPDQQRALANINQREMMQRNAPENRTIPDTTGQFNLSGLFKEIDDATNLVG